MKALQKAILIAVLLLPGCTIIRTEVYPPAGTGTVEITINADRTVTTTPGIKADIQADGNTVPVSAMP